MILSKTVLVKLHPLTFKHYESLGYIIPKYFDEQHYRWQVKRGTTIEVKIKHLTPNSHVNISCQCDNPKCNKINIISYKNYQRSINKIKKYLCWKCATSSLEFKSKVSKNNWNNTHKGKLSPNYNHKLTQEERLINKNRKSLSEYQQWKKNILKRDFHTCQIPSCNHTTNLCIHHKNSWSKFPLERIDNNNGITLCNYHHKLLHKMFGRCTTKKHYDAFIIAMNSMPYNKY